jgi:hypothetical protein
MRLHAELEAYQDWYRVLCEEVVLAGYTGGDRDQVLASIRAMRADLQRLTPSASPKEATPGDCHNCGGDGYSVEGGDCPACKGTGRNL